MSNLPATQQDNDLGITIPMSMYNKLNDLAHILAESVADNITYEEGKSLIAGVHMEVQEMVETWETAIVAAVEERDAAIEDLSQLEEAIDDWEYTDNLLVKSMVTEVQKDRDEMIEEDALDYSFQRTEENVRSVLFAWSGSSNWTALHSLAAALSSDDPDYEFTHADVAVLRAILAHAEEKANKK
jgi:N-acetylglutamate synthase-like GNAT family acetyltransferase